MKKAVPFVIAILAFCIILWVVFGTKQCAYDRAIDRLKEENKAVRKQLDSAYLVIYKSKQLEIDLKASIMRLQTANNLLIGEAETSNKRLVALKKQRTGILSDAKYDSILNELYPKN